MREYKIHLDGIEFFRFTEKELQLRKNMGLADRSFSTAGVRMEFETDSKEMLIKFSVKATMQRTYMALDVLVNGERIGSSETALKMNCWAHSLPLILMSGRIKFLSRNLNLATAQKR